MYYIVFAFGLILSIINGKKKITITVFAIILAIFSYLRYGIGADYFAYQYLYNRLSETITYEFQYGLDNQEIGFRLFGSLLKGWGFSYQWYLIVIATVNIYFIFKMCKKYSKNPTASLLLYFCFYYLVWTFSGLRQGITLAVGVYYLLECIEKKNTTKFIFIVSTLSLIHVSALILLFLYFVARLNFSKRKLIVLSIFSILISVFPIANVLLKLSWIPFFDRLLPYLNNSASLINVLDFQSLGRIFFLTIVLIFYTPLSKQNETTEKIINVFIVSLLLYFVLKFSELTAARLSIYGKLLDIIILPNIYYLFKDKLNKFLYAFFIGVLCIFYLNKELATLEMQSQIIDPSDSIMIPFVNILNKDNYLFEKEYYYYLDD